MNGSSRDGMRHPNPVGFPRPNLLSATTGSKHRNQQNHHHSRHPSLEMTVSPLILVAKTQTTTSAFRILSRGSRQMHLPNTVLTMRLRDSNYPIGNPKGRSSRIWFDLHLTTHSQFQSRSVSGRSAVPSLH